MPNKNHCPSCQCGKGWRPRDGDNYFFISGAGSIGWSIWKNEDEDDSRQNFLGVYKTEAEARAFLEKVKAAVEKIREEK